MTHYLKNNKSGFTMIELLVSLAIFSVVIVGMVEVFGSSFRSYAVQGDLVDLQQNLRIAKSMIEQDLRMTGSQVSDNFNMMGKEVIPITFANGGTGSSDKLTIEYIDWAEGCGTNTSSLQSCDSLPMLLLADKFLATSSTNFSIADNDTDNNTNLAVEEWDEGCFCGGTEYESPKFGFMALIIDAEDSNKTGTFVVTGVTPHKKDSTVANGPNAKFDLNQNGSIDSGETFDNKLVNDFSENSTIRFFHPEFAKAATYELTKEGALLRTDGLENSVPIAENVEDLQFAFCGDFDEDGTADCPADTTKGEWIYKDSQLESKTDDDGNTYMDLSDDNKENVRFIHISILGKTENTHGEKISGKRPALGDHPGSSSEDHYRRRLIQSTIQLRNIA
ncbi:MAG: PilW family protein, partial [Desulfococcaceae bacterium]|nr:PilW family protein [Desulfococcaceae bacterium]